MNSLDKAMMREEEEEEQRVIIGLGGVGLLRSPVSEGSNILQGVSFFI